MSTPSRFPAARVASTTHCHVKNGVGLVGETGEALTHIVAQVKDISVNVL